MLVVLSLRLFQHQTIPKDSTPPSLSNFTFDLGNGQLRLTFNETVNPDEFDTKEIRLQSNSNTSDPKLFYDLTGYKSGLDGSPSNEVILDLLLTDLNNIKDLENLGTSVENTFIAFSESLTQDMAQNPVIPIARDSAKQAEDFGFDKCWS